jgi:hypothetical protein
VSVAAAETACVYLLRELDGGANWATRPLYDKVITLRRKSYQIVEEQFK